MQNYTQTILSQYANSPTITKLIENVNTYIDQNQNMSNFYDKIWNIKTAIEFGLDIWGNIVGVKRTILVAGQGMVALDDETYRTLILIKALANITDVTAPTLNKLIGKLFANIGRCYVLDLGNMAMRYVFEFYLTPLEYAILTLSDVFPRPAGVRLEYFQADPNGLFGFVEMSQQNVYLGISFTLGSSSLGRVNAPGTFVVQPFNQGVFYSTSAPPT